MPEVATASWIPYSTCVKSCWGLRLSTWPAHAVGNWRTAYPGRNIASVAASVIGIFQEFYTKLRCNNGKPSGWYSLGLIRECDQHNQEDKHSNWNELHRAEETCNRSRPLAIIKKIVYNKEIYFCSFIYQQKERLCTLESLHDWLIPVLHGEKRFWEAFDAHTALIEK